MEAFGKRPVARAFALVIVGVVALLGMFPSEAAVAESDEDEDVTEVEWWGDLLDAEGQGRAGAAPLIGSRPAPAPEVEALPDPEVELPQPEVADVTLEGEGRATEAGGTPFALMPASDAGEGRELRVEVLAEDERERLGATLPQANASPLAAVVTGAADAPAAGARAADAPAVPVELTIDYRGFEHAYGAGFVDRAQVVAAPACALASPVPGGCELRPVPLPVRRDAEASELVVAVDDLAAPSGGDAAREAAAAAADGPAPAAPTTVDGSEGLVLVVTAGVSGETGTFAASPLATSADWQVALGSGEFSWSYDIPVTAPQVGVAPEVGIGYSSGAVDGLTSGRNTQAGYSGVGWSDFHSNFIERRYTTCSAVVPVKAAIDDLCWETDNATLSLNGVATEMVRLSSTDATQWRLRNNPGWRVERPSTGRPAANGDDDNEFWKVTTPDGTQYWFGWGTNPASGAATDSVWTVPVFADDPGDPCGQGDPDVEYCQQAWRWNLDRVVDPNGTTMAYTYGRDNNRYRALRGWGAQDLTYTRSGFLTTIEYGAPAGAPWRPSGRVTFEPQYRCKTLSGCPAPNGSNPADYWDVPSDLICVAAGVPCSVWSPTFFSGRRYARVAKHVNVDGAWRDVDEVTLTHQFLANSDGDRKLYLAALTQKGLVGTDVPLPPVTVTYGELPNRVDVNLAQGRKPMGHFRPTVISDEYGGEVRPTYGQPHACAAGFAGPWETNATNCFPQRVGSGTGVFHKYVTTQVEERDTTGGSPAIVTTYDYAGTPAWHHDDDDFHPLADQTWSDWRGYETVTVSKGATRTRYKVFRGMHGDRLSNAATNPPRRSVFVEPADGAGFDAVPAVADDAWMAGLVLQETSLGALNEAIDSTHHEYLVQVDALGTAPEDWATWVAENRTTQNVARGLSAFEAKRTTTTYTSTRQPETVLAEGWVAVTGDERCTRTTYATNDTAFMRSYPATSVLLAGTCSSTTELTRGETYYDNSTTVGAPVTKGNPTRERVRTNGSTWVTASEASYDAFGRILTRTDGNGNVTTNGYAFTPNGGFPETTTETNDLGHVTSTRWLPEYGVPIEVTDPNGKVTTSAYDGLGRLTSARHPTEATGTASVVYGYAVSGTKAAPPVVQAQTLQANDGSARIDSWVVYDSFLRGRQVHDRSPVTGKVIVSETSYDNRGLVYDETVPQAVTGTPGQGLLPVTWDNRTRTLYDPIERPSRQSWYRGTSEYSVTSTTYTHDSTRVRPPVGGNTRTVVDGLGRTTRVEEQEGAAWRTTTYGYDLADRMTSLVDPAGNRTEYTYDMAGRRLTQSDPDAGDWTFGYDANGNPTTVTDGEGNVTVTAYDDLNRPTTRRRDSASGPLLATWTYDAAGERGLPDTVRTTSPQGDWVIDVTGYDGRNRPTGRTWTVPSGATGLAGTYTVNYGYDKADNVVTTQYPAIGGLPAETVTTTYGLGGRPTGMVGQATYVGLAQYDDRGRPTTFGFGAPAGGNYSMGRAWSYDADQRLDVTTTAAQGGALASSLDLAYDKVGNVTERTTTLSASDYKECFTYDARNRLTRAVTMQTTGACSSNPANGDGDIAYERDYTYGVDGNLLTRSDGSTTRTYTYPAAGPTATRPHAPTAVGPDTYAWDDNGNLTSRTVGGQTTSFTWDTQRRMATATSAAGTSRFTYDADGQRLFREDPGGVRTMYIEGHEVTSRPSGTTATRHYAFGGEVVATRSASGVDYIGTDQQGSIRSSVAQGGTAAESTQAYDPYGQKVGAAGTFDTQRGWLGQVEDDPTGLSYLNARYYDANLGRFISPDPLYDPSRPQSINPYSYAHGNPTTNSDPSGLAVPIGAHGRSNNYHHKWKPETNQENIRRARRAHSRRIAARHATGDSRRQPSQAYVVSAQQRALGEIGNMRTSNPGAYAAMQGIAALMAMKAGNPDPRFWRSLASAGSGRALVAQANRIEAQRRIRAERDEMASHHVAPVETESDDGCGWGWSGIANCIGSGAEWAWDHKWQVAGVATGAVCITLSTGLCLAAGGALFGAKTRSTIEAGNGLRWQDHAWNAGSTLIFMTPGFGAAGASGWGGATAGVALEPVVLSTGQRLLLNSSAEAFGITCSLFESCAAPGMP